MSKYEKRHNVRPIENGLARFNLINELAKPKPPGQLTMGWVVNQYRLRCP